MELANELLEMTSEQELEQFLGKLIRDAAKAVGGLIRSPIGRVLGDALKNVAKTRAAHGGWCARHLRRSRRRYGDRLQARARWPARSFEMELEGMNEQEAEFEVARRFVRLATPAARKPPGHPGSGAAAGCRQGGA